MVDKNDKIADLLIKYPFLKQKLIERAFIQTILSKLIKELNKQFQSTIDKIKGVLGFDKRENVQKNWKPF